MSNKSVYVTWIANRGEGKWSRKGQKGTYRRRSHATFLEFLKGGSGSLGSLDKLELGLAAVGALRLRHFGEEALAFTLGQASDV